MIKSVTFKNFRNLDGKYEFNNTLNVIIGKSLNVKIYIQQLLERQKMYILRYLK